MTTFIEKKQAEARKRGSGILIDNSVREYTFSKNGLNTLISQTILDTIAECRKGVPEESVSVIPEGNEFYFIAEAESDGFNTCRQAMLEHLEGLGKI